MTFSNVKEDQADLVAIPGMQLTAIILVILRQRKLVALCAGAVTLLTVAALFVRAPRYTATAEFSPQSKKSAGGLAGVAAQLGVSVGGLDGVEQSPAFYVDLASSRTILGAIVDSLQPELPAELGVTERDPLRRRDVSVERLRDALAATFSQRTGVVTIGVTMPSPALAADLVARILREIARFNLLNRQTQASAERRFTEARLSDARAELASAEARVQGFLERNRQYQNAPQLVFEYDRLTREVGLRQQLFGSLAQAFEQAKIDEVRDTPLITIVERPQPPSRPDSRGLLRWALVAAAVGLILGTALALFLDYMRANEAGFIRPPPPRAYRETPGGEGTTPPL
ncbi:MAG: Wzz/FepE/Etk N-terminal domain-containing protein [Gemmatimonadota bacterium]|nr:Wzz/FepE/Etk N-terminal domain-containing protein [Gemmatimonadota bacterium]